MYEKAKIFFTNILDHFQLPPSKLKMRSTREKLIKDRVEEVPQKEKKKKINYAKYSTYGTDCTKQDPQKEKEKKIKYM